MILVGGATGTGSATEADYVCGNGVLEPGETCDDGDTGAGDGCSPDCTEQDPDYDCSVAGEPCLDTVVCGNGGLEGTEFCDEGAGCATCRIDAGYDCGAAGTNCHATECGDAIPERGEGCDDGNLIAGDGCGPTCQLEPTVTVGPSPSVAVTCGDGIVTGSEACDDGNKLGGDGCSSACTVESGWHCDALLTLPSAVQFAVTYRDFKGRAETGGHPDFEWNAESLANMVGTVCKSNNGGSCGRLDNAGKPAFSLDNGDSDVTSPATFALWYRDTNAANTAGQNGPIDMWNTRDSITLYQLGGATSDTYQFSTGAHYPLGDSGATPGIPERGFGLTPGQTRNYHFTTELRYFFQYKGGETLNFYGDDDVWVFINGRHAVDIGGVHTQRYGRVILGDDGDDLPPARWTG